jgi:hypothetical protein
VLSFGRVKRERYVGEMAWVPTLWRNEALRDNESPYGPSQVRLVGVSFGGHGAGPSPGAAEADLRATRCGGTVGISGPSDSGKRIIDTSVPNRREARGNGVTKSASTPQAPQMHILSAAESVAVFCTPVSLINIRQLICLSPLVIFLTHWP